MSAVDPGSGHVDILDYVTVEDVGRVINPATLHGQVLGAVVQGLGSTFLEHLQYDENGQLLTGSLADYLLPTADRLSAHPFVSLGLRPCPNNPLGAKGAGEGGLIAVGGVVSNAIAAALRDFAVQPCDLPITPAAPLAAHRERTARGGRAVGSCRVRGRSARDERAPQISVRVDGAMAAAACVELAKAAEAAGFAGVWFAENAFARGILPAAAACAVATRKLRINAGVFNPVQPPPDDDGDGDRRARRAVRTAAPQ